MNRSSDRRTGEHRLRELLEPTETAVRRVSRGALESAAPLRRRLRERLFAAPVRSLSLVAGTVAVLSVVVLVFPQRSAGPPVDLRFSPPREATPATPLRVTVVGSGRTLLVAPAIARPPGSPEAAATTVAASSEPGGSGSILLIRRRDS